MRNQSYNIFWQRIHKVARERRFPLRVMFELTYKCNFHCSHCYVPASFSKLSRQKDLKTKEIFSILDQLKDIGCFYLGFTGGEPFVRKDILDILWYARRKGFEVIIYTNGYFIDEKVADELKRLGPNKVDITLHSMNEGIFDRITQTPGSGQKVFASIKLLYERGIPLGFKSCVLKENESQIKEIQDFAHSLGALHRLDDRLSPCLDGSKEPYKYRGKLSSSGSLESDEQCDSMNITKITNTTKLTNTTSELFKCGTGRSQAAITPFGELKMCLMIDYPKYKILDTRSTPHASRSTPHATGLKSAWEKLKELVASIKPDGNYQCDRCELEPYCKWCPGKSWLQNRSFTSCDPESRRKADYNRRMMQLKETEEPKN